MARLHLSERGRRRLTARCKSSILRAVFSLTRRLVALVSVGALSMGAWAQCAGWQATPEARMACCAEGGECPMHKGRSEETRSQHVLTQAQADACCAASEQDQSKSSNPTAVTAISPAVLGVGVVLPVITPSLMLTDGWRTVVAISSAHVPKHVLLSVFLV